MTKQEQLIIILLVLAALIGTGLLYHRKFSEAPAKPEVVESKAEKLSIDAKRDIAVDVKGACWRPGVYTLSYGARVKEVIDKVNPREDADLGNINLARRLIDGESIFIESRNLSAREEPAAGVRVKDGTKNEKGGKYSKKLNINKAAKAELEKLPSIGSRIAGYIIEYRNKNGPFKQISDIKKVERVGEKTFEKIKDLITVE